MRSLRQNFRLYLMEALGLAIFMVSACFFSAILEANNSSLHHALPDPFIRNVIMGTMMGLTAAFIFYSPFTRPSGSHINPAVTFVFLRLKKISREDALFYIIFQFLGGTIAVYLMQLLMGKTLTALPVNSATTVPGKAGVWPAFLMEFAIGFVMITMVLFTSASQYLKKYTRIFSACLVCAYVIVAGPVSGFGMNPARTFASALPANTWTAFWVYMVVPVLSMLSAAEFYVRFTNASENRRLRKWQRQFGII